MYDSVNHRTQEQVLAQSLPKAKVAVVSAPARLYRQQTVLLYGLVGLSMIAVYLECLSLLSA
ncbi:MAG: hypothetical protein WBD47_03425 [Phormidesmis sp.]